MRNLSRLTVAAVLGLAIAACSGDEAQITTTTLDAASLTTTTTSASTGENGGTTGDTAADGQSTTSTTAAQVQSWEIITRTSSEEGETLYILVSPGEYSDVSIENFLGDLLEEETAVSGVEIFDDRAALDAALKPEDERTDEERQLIQQHHLVSLVDGRQVEFRGPLSEYPGFVIGS